MFKILILIVSTVCTSLHATTQYELSADQLRRVPLLLHQDAREFHRTLSPLIDHEATHYYGQQLKNPYELFFGALIFDELFGVVLPYNTGACLKEGIESILKESDQDRIYMLNLSQIPQISSNQTVTYSVIEQHQSQFNQKFSTTLDDLFAHKNLFAFFMKGLMEYESGVIHNNQNQKQLGEKYISIAADGYVLPALSFLRTIYAHNPKQKIIHDVARDKLAQTANLNLNPSIRRR